MAKRTAPVFAMKVPEDTIGTTGETKIFDDEKGRVVETTFVHKEILLSNPGVGGEKSENEWPKGKESFFRDYVITEEEFNNREPGKRYEVKSPLRQAKPLLKVTPEVIQIMGGENGVANLPTSWDIKGANIKEGSFITQRGTPLSKRDFESTYTEITEEKWLEKNIININKKRKMSTIALFMKGCHKSENAISDIEQKKITNEIDKLYHIIAEGEIFYKNASSEETENKIHEIVLYLKWHAAKISDFTNNTTEATKKILDKFQQYKKQFGLSY